MTMQNFRPVQGTSRIYRCAKTEPLAVQQQEGEAERIISQEVGLVIDLRSPAERDDEAAAIWMQRWGFASEDATALLDQSSDSSSSSSTSFISSDDDDEEEEMKRKKRVLLIDVQPRDRVLRYLTENWLSRGEQVLNLAWTALDSERQHRMRMDALNERGLLGLNEAILETGGRDLCLALIEMTKHLETEESSIVFHCVQGKDRTGMLAMLCQSIMGASDVNIIEEYAKSETMRDASAAAGNIVTVKGRFDRGRFTGAPPDVMRETLEYVRSKYMSINPGYLDHIGFDQSWRSRFLKCQQTSRL